MEKRKNGAMLDELVSALRMQLKKDGHLPSERVLASQLNAKRHQIRRGLGVLQQEGALSRPQRRRRSMPVSQWQALLHETNPLEILEMRMAIEPAIVRQAAMKASLADIARIRGALESFPTDDSTASRSADIQFHRLLAAASRNTLAMALLQMLGEITTDVRLHLVLPPQVMRAELEEHRLIADAIERRNPAGAEEAMRTHLASAQQWAFDLMQTDRAA